MAFDTNGRTRQMIQEELDRQQKTINNNQKEQTSNLEAKYNELEKKLHGKSPRQSVGFSLEPEVKTKIKRLAVEHHYSSMSEFVNDVFKYWE